MAADPDRTAGLARTAPSNSRRFRTFFIFEAAKGHHGMLPASAASENPIDQCQKDARHRRQRDLIRDRSASSNWAIESGGGRINSGQGHGLERGARGGSPDG